MAGQRHKNSKLVTVRRGSTFISKAQGLDVKDFMTSALRGVGSYFEGKGSKRVSSGMTPTEEAVLVPELIGVAKEDRAYFEERNRHYANFETKIPAEGLELEIGLEVDNDAPVSKENLPLNIQEYIRYKHISGHPWVAASEALATGNQTKKFFIDDPVLSSQGKADVTKEKDEALAFYLQVKDNTDKVNMLITLLGKDYRDINGQTDRQTVQLRQEYLRTQAQDVKQVANFIKLNKDRNFEIKYKLQSLVNTDVVKVVGSKYLINETGESLGNYEEAIEFLKDETKNSSQIAVLNAKLQEGLKTGRRSKRKQELK